MSAPTQATQPVASTSAAAAKAPVAQTKSFGRRFISALSPYKMDIALTTLAGVGGLLCGAPIVAGGALAFGLADIGVRTLVIPIGKKVQLRIALSKTLEKRLSDPSCAIQELATQIKSEKNDKTRQTLINRLFNLCSDESNHINIQARMSALVIGAQYCDWELIHSALNTDFQNEIQTYKQNLSPKEQKPIATTFTDMISTSIEEAIEGADVKVLGFLTSQLQQHLGPFFTDTARKAALDKFSQNDASRSIVYQGLSWTSKAKQILRL